MARALTTLLCALLCGCGSAGNQQTIAANLQTWTQHGGRLFVTDNSYDYVAQAFPSGYLNQWSLIQSLPMTTDDIVDATNAQAYPSATATTPGPAMSYPQTIRFDVAAPGSSQACDRAIYTSYHTLPTTTSDPTQLVPQERILEYLMLEAGACVGPIG